MMKYFIVKILRDMDSLWKSCQRLSNVTIRCHDGLISTHKIILASVSSFTKEILEDIPSGDQVTVLMPDFGSGPIEDFLSSWMNQKDFDPEIDRAFRNTIKKEQDAKENISIVDGKENPSVEEPDGKDNLSVGQLDGKENPSVEELDGKENPSVEELAGRENPSVELLFQTEEINVCETEPEHFDAESFLKDKLKSTKNRTSNAKKRKREFDVSLIPLIDAKIQSLQHDLILLPLNDKDVKYNTRKVKSIALQKAFKEIVLTGCSNRKAAKKFGISENRLRVLFKYPEKDEYMGGIGRRGKVSMLTQEEEKIIVKKALAVSDDGLYMNCPLLKTVMDEEIDILNKDQPGRNIPHFPKHVVWRFGHRHRLFEKSNERKALEKQVECDVCFHKFTNTKSVSDHKKATHFAFLNTHLYSVRTKKSVDKKLNF